MKAVERAAPAAAMLAALSALACCLPFGLVGALGLATASVWIAPLRPWLLGFSVLLLVLVFGKSTAEQISVTFGAVV